MSCSGSIGVILFNLLQFLSEIYSSVFPWKSQIAIICINLAPPLIGPVWTLAANQNLLRTNRFPTPDIFNSRASCFRPFARAQLVYLCEIKPVPFSIWLTFYIHIPMAMTVWLIFFFVFLAIDSDSETHFFIYQIDREWTT
jgi:hypothetical protein